MPAVPSGAGCGRGSVSPRRRDVGGGGGRVASFELGEDVEGVLEGVGSFGMAEERAQVGVFFEVAVEHFEQVGCFVCFVVFFACRRRSSSLFWWW